MPQGLSYHRKCYQYFTMKSTLNRIQKEKDEIQNTIASYNTRDSDDETSISRPRRGHGLLHLRILPHQLHFLFCGVYSFFAE